MEEAGARGPEIPFEPALLFIFCASAFSSLLLYSNEHHEPSATAQHSFAAALHLHNREDSLVFFCPSAQALHCGKRC